MTWSDFYLICFAVGFLLSAISFLFGGVRGHTHLPHLPHAGGHTLNTHTFGGHGDSATHGNGGAGGHASQHSVSPFNFVTLTAFLAWFGGTGFLITRFSGIWFALGLVIAMAAGLLGAGIVFLFLTRVLISTRRTWMQPITKWWVCSGVPQFRSAKAVRAKSSTPRLARAEPVVPGAKAVAPSQREPRLW